ncbi:poly-gamma-glutamate hydrolase family protein [Streptomyces abikoensis]|uniref:poly-gamma-glutamate hydrolase family protein n=1 Tax=Streptomyces abikoensis TaxID=97398 RepID=UPI001671995C|nr:poly-gamma-glutamate hydrolase family protein [Streptomyces abikoensis]
MRSTTRRSLLTGMAAAAVAVPLATTVTTPAWAAADTEFFASNTELYASPLFKEGTDWARRYRRTGLDTVPGHSRATPPLTSVVAPHGGNLEDGTSELCLAVAGYAPEDPMTRYGSGGGPAYDYWMFDVLATDSRAVQQMHVTSTHCDDPAALAIVGGSRHAVSVHGCKNPGGSGTQKLVQIGGRDKDAKKYLYDALRARLGTSVALTLPTGGLDGDEPLNICNRTYSGAGAQLEISTELRRAMFGDFSSPATRAATYGRSADGKAAPYWNGFVTAVREAIAQIEQSGG